MYQIRDKWRCLSQHKLPGFPGPIDFKIVVPAATILLIATRRYTTRDFPGDTMSQACKKMNLRYKLDLRLLVWKEDSALFDDGTGEVAKMATQSKLVSDKLKSGLATKCHLNDF
ncbi:unnamed protein product [Mucor circinelloides]